MLRKSFVKIQSGFERERESKRLRGFVKFLFFFFLFLFSSSLIFPSKTLAATTYDMATTTNWNIRIDGPETNSPGESKGGIGLGGAAWGDIDGDGKLDLIIGDPYTDFNSRTDSGSVYVILNPLFKDLAGKGNTIDLVNPSNYNFRLDGATDGSLLSHLGKVGLSDIDNDGKKDILIGSYWEDNNSRENSGSLYVIYSSFLSGYAGTGNNFDLASASNYSLRFDGPIANARLTQSYGPVETADFDNDGKQDIILNAFGVSYNSRSYSGSVYIIYNTLISQYTSQNIDLADSSKYNIRLDGAATFDSLGYQGKPTMGDFNGDNKQDLLVSCWAYISGNRNGCVYLFYNNLISKYSGTGNNIDLATSTNYNFRFNGASDDDTLGQMIKTSDLDNDGKDDIVVNAPFVDTNGRTDNGVVYVIYSSLFSQYSGTGNTLNMGTSSNYNLRFAGENTGDADDWLGDISLSAGDIDGDGKSDLLFGGAHIDGTNGTRVNSGVTYTIYNRLFSSYSGMGNNIDLATSTNYSLKYDGATARDHLVIWSIPLVDINSDGTNDLTMTAHLTDYNSRTDSGSVYIIYNFPHSITLTSSGKDKIVGTVTAPNSVTSVSGVQYNYNSNDPGSSGWTNCSGTTSFTCTFSNFPSGSSNKVYIRAFDTNGSYTAQSSYALASFVDGTSSSSGPSDPNCLWNFKYCITSGPHHQGSNSYLTNQGVSIFSSDTTHHDDLYIQLFKRSTDYLSSQTPRVPYPWEQGFNTASDIFEVKVLSAFNGYPINLLDNPATISLPYISSNPSNLRIGYYDGIRWKAIPNNTVNDWVNKTISNTTKIFNTYFAVVYPSYSLPTTPVVGTTTETTTTQSETPTPEMKPNPPTQQPMPQPKSKTCFLWWCW